MEAVIIRTYPYRESDLILRVIADNGEKRSLLARSNRSSRRFGTTFDIFDQGRFETKAGRGSLSIVSSFTPISSFRVLRESLGKFSAASFLCECFDLMVPDDAGSSPQVYETLTLGLRAIVEGKSSKEELRGAYLSIASLFQAIGYGTDKERQPSVQALHALINRVEELTDRKLSTRAALEEMMKALAA